MATHGYYATPHWKALRATALRRDGYRCTVAGCGRRATHVDHIDTRPRCVEPTPFDRLDNLRSLCATHDAQIKEHRGRGRGRNGRPALKGCGVDGWPFGRAGPLKPPGGPECKSEPPGEPPIHRAQLPLEPSFSQLSSDSDVRAICAAPWIKFVEVSPESPR